MRNWLRTSVLAVALGMVLGSVVPINAQGPFTAQIQRAINSLTSGSAAFTAIKCGGTVGTANQVLIGGAACAWSGTPSITSWTTSAADTLNLLTLGSTSTDGLIIQNTTAATGGVPVQIGPRDKKCGTAWNSVGSASETDCWITEVLPATQAGATTSEIDFSASIASGAYTNRFKVVSNGAFTLGQLACDSSGACTLGNGNFYFSGRSGFSSPANAQFNITNTAVTAGIGFDVSTDGTLSIRNRAQNAAGTILAGSYSLAATTALPADQTGNATSTLKMNGLGAAGAPCTITPTSTGRVVFMVSGDLTNSVILDGISYKLVFGTGAAPANAAAATGTAISALRGPAAPVAAQKQGFSVQGETTGLALATAVWYDLQVADVTGGTASISNVTCTAHEI